MIFIKTKCNVINQWYDKEQGKDISKMTQEIGYLYKNLLHIRKMRTDTWQLSHQSSGYSIVMLRNMKIEQAKMCTILINSLFDWSETDIEKIRENFRGIGPKVNEIINATETELENIRLDLLKTAEHTTANLIDLMMA